ncbi:AcrR family transcriptional regulator [Pullulanibacillus pueri]|uniref:TetR family transcriptional regulator n=1 Tax=Pullulanibacillus pueri TaxID=1437324 RepID=A0A8J2ZTY1_9BACL|nr:TetR/AcrR family transcriptional regulator [Pullulanibacillus pueri]MBM7681097.1 AcrR family transcriptional regulator [Pullulanibacillus pueri]GGH77033.1 TetR family transcriptional regulator [Pullulanibacillus pueri]
MTEWEDIESTEKLTEKQKLIIQAAIESFAEKGFAGTSTSTIAKKAGVAEGTIFRHYKTKKELLISIVIPVVKHFLTPFIVRDLNKVLDQTYHSFEDFVRAMFHNRKVFIEKNKKTIKIILQEIPFHEELRDIFKRYVATEPISKVLEIIRHFQEKGELIEGSPYTILRLAASSIAGYFIARHIVAPEVAWNEEEEIEATIAFIMRGIGS